MVRFYYFQKLITTKSYVPIRLLYNNNSKWTKCGTEA